MGWIDSFRDNINLIIETVPLPIVVFLGSFIEDFFPPIPSSIILLASGSVSRVREYPLISILLLAITSGVAKTSSGLVLYQLGDKMEDVLIGKYGKYFGIKHETIEAIGKKLDKGWRDNVVLLLVRILPFFSSAVTSVVCGILRVKPYTFYSTTFIGSSIRDFGFLYLGYIGVSSFTQIADTLQKTEVEVEFIVALVSICIVLWGSYSVFVKRKKEA